MFYKFINEMVDGSPSQIILPLGHSTCGRAEGAISGCSFPWGRLRSFWRSLERMVGGVRASVNALPRVTFRKKVWEKIFFLLSF